MGWIGVSKRVWRMGLENSLSSLFHPERTPGWMTHPRTENRVDLTRFRTFLLQPIVITKLNFQDSRFALLS